MKQKMKPEDLTKLNPEKLAELLDTSSNALTSALSAYNRIVVLDLPIEQRAELLEQLTEVPGKTDIGSILSKSLVELGPVENLGSLTQIKGIYIKRLSLIVQKLSTLDLDEIISSYIQPVSLENTLSLSGGDAILELPWFIDFMPNEVVALNGYITSIDCKGNSRPAFQVAPELTGGIPVIKSLSSGNLPVPSVSSEMVGIVANTLLDGSLKPLMWLPPYDPTRLLMGWIAKNLIVASNQRTIQTILALKAEICDNLVEIFDHFGVGPENGPQDESHLFHSLFLKLAIEKLLLDLKTLSAAVDALEACLPRIADEEKRARIAKAIEAFRNGIQSKNIFDSQLLLPVLGNDFNPREGSGEFSGFPFWDRKISELLLDILSRLKEFVDDINDIQKKTGNLGPNPPLGGVDDDTPSNEDLNKRLNDAEKKYKDYLNGFKEEQKINEEKITKRINDACPRGALDDIIREITILLDGCYSRNEWLLRVLVELSSNELRSVRYARRLIRTINSLMEMEKQLIDEAIKREQEALKDGQNPTLHAAKLNLLLQLQKTIEDQVSDLFPGGGHVFSEEDEIPDTLEGLLDAKEEESKNASEWLKDRDKKLKQFYDEYRDLLK